MCDIKRKIGHFTKSRHCFIENMCIAFHRELVYIKKQEKNGIDFKDRSVAEIEKSKDRVRCIMAKIEDVARMAGVSPASVSRYLNNRELLRDETADKIRVAIEKLNYSPNPVAVGLRTGHFKMVAFIIPTMNNLYYIELFNDMHHRCTECGYTLCLYSVEDDLELLKKIISELSEFQYEGAIVSYLDEPEVMKEIQNLRRRMPVVLISANDMRTDFDMVYLDVCEATCSAARHYIQKNYQNIAFIGGGAPKAPRIIIKKKLAGYLKAMEEVGRQPLLGTSEESMTEELADGMTAGILGAQSLVRSGLRPDAIICSLDIIAIGVNRYLRENGYRIPEDVAVVGFSGTTLASIYDPAISTIVQPLDDMARGALSLLLRRIKDPECEPKRLSYQTFLREGRVP